MNKNTHTLDIDNLVATAGFHFSGSGLVNDIFIASGYLAPKNIRADEFFHNTNNFSWPRALDNEYGYSKKMILACRVVKTIVVRLPINIIQKTPIYNKYLSLKGRGVKLHQSTSVNRSLWPYLVSLYMIFSGHDYDERLFIKWLGLKYRWQIYSSNNLLLDNGIPRDKRIADWFFGINGSIGIFVYRSPRVQYQQMVQIYKITGRLPPSYDNFLNELESKYQSISWILDSNYKFIFISFDKLLNDIDYRNRLEVYFKQMNILSEINYDFSESIKNNESLSSLSEKIVPSKKSIKTEDIIRTYHELFENKLYDNIGR